METVEWSDVLKTRTSEKNGAAPTIDATVGIVTRLGSSSAAAAGMTAANNVAAIQSFFMVISSLGLRRASGARCARSEFLSARSDVKKF